MIKYKELIKIKNKEALEYAKYLYEEDIDEEMYAPDVQQTIGDFKNGWNAAVNYLLSHLIDVDDIAKIISND